MPFRSNTIVMTVSRHKEKITALFAGALIFLFVYTALSKLMHLRNFRFALMQQPYFKPFASFLAISIPLLEVLIAALLFFPSMRNAGFLASALLMSCFTLYVGLMLVFSSSLPCSCGGIVEQLSWKAHLLVNAVVTVLSWAAFQLNIQKDQRILLQ